MKLTSILLFIFNTFSFIQAGSVHSSEGLGLPLLPANGQSMGMGGVSIAVPDEFNLPRVNPAGLYAIQLSRFAIQYRYESNKYKTDEGSARSPHSNFDGFIFGIPIASRCALAFGLKPYSQVNYKTSLSNQVNNTSFSQIVSGSGGLNTLDLSGSLKLLKSLAIGISCHFYFGLIEKNWLVDFTESQYYTTKDTYATKATGYGTTVGLQYEPISGLILGTVFKPSTKLKSKTYLDYKAIEDNSETTYIYYRDTLNGHIDIPASIGFGLGWRINNRLRLGSDMIYTDWKSMKINDHTSDNTQSVMQYAFGFEYHASHNPYASLFKKCVYRAGFSYHPLYIKNETNDSIHEWWVTTGISIPIWNNSSRANIAIGYGQRGSQDANGLSEKLLRIILSLDAGEKWFVRRR
ncbi:hypothetical protein JW835_00710 [bacterium]|nr:hypothetical protein [bacterium]